MFDEFKNKLKLVADNARSGLKPFFMALGFTRPHMNLICPEEFIDMYKLEGEHYLVDVEWQRPR